MTYLRLTACTLAVLASTSCARADRPAVETAVSPVAVAMATAALENLAEGLEAGGVVAASTSADIGSQVTGTVVDVRVRAGDRVSTGQVMVVLDQRGLVAAARQTAASTVGAEQALVAARSDEAVAVADLALAESWSTRIAALRRQNSATLQEQEDADARLATARARLDGNRARVTQMGAGVEAARAAADAAMTAQSYATITAPFDGLVTETHIDPGSLAVPGTPLLRLDSVGVAEVHVRVDEARAAHVRVGDRVDVRLGGGVAGAPLVGTVREVSRAVAVDDHAFTVKIALPSASAVRAGTFARVRFAGASRQALTVPASAVTRQGQVTAVFVVDGAVARLRLVQVGMVDDLRAEVLAGLDAGERIVLSPPPQLVDGAPVSEQGGTP